MSPSNQTTPTLLEKYPIFLAGRSRMITEKDSLKEIKLLERTRNTSNRAALHRKNYKAL